MAFELFVSRGKFGSNRVRVFGTIQELIGVCRAIVLPLFPDCSWAMLLDSIRASNRVGFSSFSRRSSGTPRNVLIRLSCFDHTPVLAGVK